MIGVMSIVQIIFYPKNQGPKNLFDQKIFWNQNIFFEQQNNFNLNYSLYPNFFGPKK